MKDFLIIGQGLAGSLVGYELLKAGVSIDIVDDPYDSSSSKVAAGIFNPITGKRKVKTWLADDLFSLLPEYYGQLEQELNTTFLHSRPIYKPFHDAGDQNDLMSKSTSSELGDYIDVHPDNLEYSSFVNNKYGAIDILKGGNVELKPLIEGMKNFFTQENCYLNKKVNFGDLEVLDESIQFNSKSYRNVIFCDGYKATKNPLFHWLPFSVTLGQILLVEIPDFPQHKIVNKGFFILPKGDQKFIVGSSYELTDEEGITEKGKGQILKKLNDLIKVPYEVLDQYAGIRPTVRDRRPFIGTHPEYRNVHIFNGLGTKGVSLAPYFVKQFKKYLLESEKLDKEVNIERYFSLFYSSAQK